MRQVELWSFRRIFLVVSSCTSYFLQVIFKYWRRSEMYQIMYIWNIHTHTESFCRTQNVNVFRLCNRYVFPIFFASFLESTILLVSLFCIKTCMEIVNMIKAFMQNRIFRSLFAYSIQSFCRFWALVMCPTENKHTTFFEVNLIFCNILSNRLNSCFIIMTLFSPARVGYSKGYSDMVSYRIIFFRRLT